MPNYLLSSKVMKISTSVHKVYTKTMFYAAKKVTIPRAFILIVAAKLKEDKLRFRESTPLHVKLTTELIMREKNVTKIKLLLNATYYFFSCRNVLKTRK